MNGVIKWAGIVLGGVIGLVAIALGAVLVISNARLNQTVEVPAETFTAPTDEESIARGEHLVEVNGCNECHGPDLGGTAFFNDPALAVIAAPNLTSGEGGAGQTFTDLDYEHAIRHGVDPDGKALFIMPANEFAHMSNQDVGDIIAYIRSVPPVDQTWSEPQVGLMGRTFMVLGLLKAFPAESIDQTAGHVDSVEPGVTAEYGQYLSQGCTACHGPQFAGGPVASLPPDAPPAANLTPDEATGIGTWSEEDFFKVLRQGIPPDGSEISEYMPWQSYSNMTDDELHAIWLFLQSLPPVDNPAAVEGS